MAVCTLLAIDIYQTFAFNDNSYIYKNTNSKETVDKDKSKDKSISYQEPIEIYSFLEEHGFKGVPVKIVYNKSDKTPAWYKVKEKTIYLNNAIQQDKSVMELLWHEYGHNLWYEKLTQEQRDSYKTIYQEAELFPTKYSIKGGVKEDFAESFAYYMLGRYNQIPDDRQAYIVKLRNQDVI